MIGFSLDPHIPISWMHQFVFFEDDFPHKMIIFFIQNTAIMVHVIQNFTSDRVTFPIVSYTSPVSWNTSLSIILWIIFLWICCTGASTRFSNLMLWITDLFLNALWYECSPWKPDARYECWWYLRYTKRNKDLTSDTNRNILSRF